MVEKKEDMSKRVKIKDTDEKNFTDIGKEGQEVDDLITGVKCLTVSASDEVADQSGMRSLNGRNVPEESDPDDCGVDPDPGHHKKKPDSPAVPKEETELEVVGLEEGIKGLMIDEREHVKECSRNECTERAEGLMIDEREHVKESGSDECTECAESKEATEIGEGDIAAGIRELSIVARGQGDGSEMPDVGDGQRGPEENETTESEDSERENTIVIGDVKAYIRIDNGPNQLRNRQQIAQIGAEPSREFDCCDAPLHHGIPGKFEIVARAPEDAFATARAPVDSYKRKGRLNMTGGGIVGGNETNMPLGFEDHRIQKAMRPMPGSGGFTTSSRSGMTGGSVRGSGMPGHLPQINDPLLVPSGPLQSSSLPSIDALWHQQSGDQRLQNFSLSPNMPNMCTDGRQKQVYQFGNTEQLGSKDPFGNMSQFQNSNHEKEVHEIENYLRTSESDFSEKSVASPYGGSSGIGSPGSMSAASPGSAFSDVGDRMHKVSESSEDEGVGMGHHIPHTPLRPTGRSDFDLDIITELIGEKMGATELTDKKVQASPTSVTTQESVLKTQLIQPPIYTPLSPQSYGQQSASQVPQTTNIVTTTANMPMPGAVIVVYNVQSAAPMKKGPVPILPRPEGAPCTNAAIPQAQPKKRATRKKNSKSKASPTPKSGSPKTGPDSVFFAPSPDGSSSDASMYANSCQMSPVSMRSVSSPDSSGLPSTIQDAQLPMTLPGMSTFQNGQGNFQGGVPTTVQQNAPMSSFQLGQPMTQMGQVSLASSQGVCTTGMMGGSATFPMSTPAPLTTSNAMSSTGFAPKMEPGMMQHSTQVISDPFKISSPGEFPRPVAIPPHQKRANRPGLKIDTSCSNVTNGNQSNTSNNMSLTPVPASPSTPTRMSQKSRASCINNSLPQAKFEMIDSDGDSLLHQFIVHVDPDMVDAFLARCKRQGCLHKFIDLKNYDGQTPLYLAALVSDVEIVKILLEYGADATITNNDFTSPLHCAAKKCQFGYEIMDLLLTMPEKKLNLSAKDCHGLTPLHIAIQVHGVPVEDQSQKTESTNGAKKLVPGDSLKTVELLFQHGASAHDKASKDGRNALHFAIERKSLEMMALVLKYGSAKQLVTDPTDSGNTGLHIAAGLQMDDVAMKVSMIQLLETNGADIDVCNRENRRPKDLVDDPKHSGSVIVALFLKLQQRMRQKSNSQISHPGSPQEIACKQTGQNTPKKTAQTQPQRSNASQGTPTTNIHENAVNSDSWRNPEMMGYMNPTMPNPPELFGDQLPLYGQGLCETSDNSIEAIVTSLVLDNAGMGQMNGQTNIDQAYTQADLNALYSQLDVEPTYSQPATTAGMEQRYAMSQASLQYTPNTVTSTSGMSQQYSQTLTGASGNTQGYTQTINQLNSQPYSQPSQTYSHQIATNPTNQPLTLSNQYRPPPATASNPAPLYPQSQSYPNYPQPGPTHDNQMMNHQQQAAWNPNTTVNAWATGSY
ncbi:uncharacterized protein LOC135501999 [Lineus longissimus]|uniref:uncharacterized protein LOC135501999 n=1 Tax=Lineus longissimus TaxID=88925 RepID=UPI00315DB126